MSLTLVKDEPGIDTLPKLNLGCGLKPEKGFVNLDFFKSEGVDVVHDMTVTPWPFPDNHFGVISAEHVLEHIPMEFVPYGDRKVDALVAVMNEAWRVLAPGGRFLIQVPTVHGQGAFQDPTHRRFLCENSIYYFSRKPAFVEGTPDFEELNFQRYLAEKQVSFSVYSKMPLTDKNKAREDAKEWAMTEEGKPKEWNWSWYGADIGCVARFDCIRAELDGPTAFMTFWLVKPKG